jgi:hypothetical protein
MIAAARYPAASMDVRFIFLLELFGHPRLDPVKGKSLFVENMLS